MIMKIDFNWKEVWDRKGNEDIDDPRILNGYRRTTINLQEVAKDIVNKLHISESDKILEVGCGAGGLAQYLKGDYVGIDYSQGLVKKHIELFNNSVLCGEANNLPFKDRSFDKVICYSVFHYFPTQEYAQQVISEMKRVAKKAIYIGDLPIKSHRDEHQLYKKENFKDWIISPGNYNEDRFNALYLIKDK